MKAALGIGCLILSLLGSEPVSAGDSDLEAWYVIAFDDQPIGYEQVRIVKPVPDAATPVSNVTAADGNEVKCFRRTELQFTRMGQDLTVRASLQTQQSSSGVLSQFSLHRTDGKGTRLERMGQRIPNSDHFVIQEKVSATRREYQMLLAPGTFSPILTTWLPNLNLTQTRRVTVPVFFPETAAIANLNIEQQTDRRLRMSDGPSLNTRRVVFSPDNSPTSVTTFYIDESDTVVRQERPILGGTLSLERSTAERALSAASVRSLDLEAATMIPIDRLLSASADQKKLVLDLTVKDTIPVQVPETDFQKVQVINPSTTRITLTRPEQKRIRNTSQTARVHQPAIKSTRWMPLEDTNLQRLAAIAAGGQTDVLEVCQRLEKFVNSKLQRSAFSTGMLTADEVARTLKGDCTEHAVFLAALMRIHHIPSRIAIGLVHTTKQYGFVGHAWTEALVDGQWLPFDSVMSSEGGRVTHIKLADSELPDDMTSGIALFLPVLEITGHAEIQVIAE